MTRVARHLRMTEADKQRKIAAQYRRRLEKGSTSTRGNLKWKLGTEQYWALYNEYFEEQQGRCAICNKAWEEGKARMALDHCHETFVIRGLLCYSCNTKLGFVTKYFDAIIKYLGYERV